MRTALHATLVVLGTIVISLAGLLLVRTVWPTAGQVGNNEIGDDFITVLGAAYGILIAFMVSAVWNRYTAADQDADAEANHILALINCTLLLDHPTGMRFVRDVLSYGHSVVEDEWPLLAQGRGSDRTRELLHGLWESFDLFVEEPARREFVRSQALVCLQALTDSRRVRLFNCDDSVPSVLWILLFFEGAITVAFTYLLIAPTLLLQALMTAALAATIAASLYLIRVLDHPFRGDVFITSENLRDQLLQWELTHPALLRRAEGETQQRAQPDPAQPS